MAERVYSKDDVACFPSKNDLFARSRFCNIFWVMFLGSGKFEHEGLKHRLIAIPVQLTYGWKHGRRGCESPTVFKQSSNRSGFVSCQTTCDGKRVTTADTCWFWWEMLQVNTVFENSYPASLPAYDALTIGMNVELSKNLAEGSSGQTATHSV